MINNFQENLIKENDSLLLAVSGGIDSMVLLDIIYKLRNKLNLTLYIAHVDHQKRDSSKDDRDFVIEKAKTLNIPCFVEKLENKDDENFHHYAHKKRYDFFVRVAKENNIKKIVLAHNANDNAETILMRLSRGSSFEGYRGILNEVYYQDVLIIRPLIGVSRADIEVYQQANLVAYQNDPTNDLDDYTRNRFRHHILPLLEEENPKFLSKISQFSYYQQLSYNLIYDLSNEFIKNLKISDKVIVPLNDFRKLSKIVQIETIKQVINILTNDSIELSFTNILDIIELCYNEKPHVKFIIENELYIYKSYENLTFSIKEIKIEDYNFTIENFGDFHLPNDNLIVIDRKPNKNYGFIYKLCYNNLDLIFPLTVRNRRDGDKINSTTSTKKLKDILIKNKVPLEKRDSLPIFINKSGDIIFIPGIFQAETTGDKELYIMYKED